MRLRFNVFGRELLLERREDCWLASWPGSDGKRRPAHDIRVPGDVPEAELERYLGDLCHEWASPRHRRVERLE